MRVLVNAGPTREFLDTVKFLTTPSSGKMGYALAGVAAKRGHRVVLVTGPVEIKPPAGVRAVIVTTASEMLAVCRREFRSCQAALMTAAVCDYRPRVRADKKLWRRNRPLAVTLEPTEDICATLGRIKAKRVVIGFAMEDHDHRKHAEQKLRRKNCDAIVLNGPENRGGDRATVRILTADGKWSAPVSGTKRAVAGHIIRLAEHLAGQA